MKYSTVEKTKNGYTHLVAYPDETGIETEDGLNHWETEDNANRGLIFADNKEKANAIVKAFENKTTKTMKHIKTFEDRQNKENKNLYNKLNETGEWDRDVDLQYVLDNPDEDGEFSNWIKGLHDELLTIKDILKDEGVNLEINDIKGFDKYQGPYANITIDGKNFTVWTAEFDELYIEDFPINNMNEDENPGFRGTAFEIAEAILSLKTTNESKLNESEQALSNDVSTELNREMKKIWNFNKFTDHRCPRGIITPGKFLDLGEKKGYINRIEGDTIFVESIDGSNEMLEVSFADVAKSYKIKTFKEEIYTKQELKEGSGDVANPIDKKEKGKKDDKTEKIQKKAQTVTDKKLKTKLSGPTNESKLNELNLNKHIWEGWTVQDFIDDLEPQLDMIMTGGSWQDPLKTKAELKKWCMENQPYYKKYVPDVVNYFAQKYNIK